MVVCAEPHAWRCVRDLELAAHEAAYPVMIEVSDAIRTVPRESWFCSDSLAWQTSSTYRWLFYDLALRLMPTRLYVGIGS